VGRSLILLLIYALLLAAATFIEKYASTAAAKTIIYYSPVIILLQVVIVVNFITVAIKHHLLSKHKWGFLFIHGAFIVILSGAFVTHIWGEEGIIHIREGQSTNLMLVRTNKGDIYKNLPFNIRLKKFILTPYPGSSHPSSFESILVIHEDGSFTEKTVSVNNVLDIKGYRLFQASYDRDEKGTVLAANKDIPGRQITYAGYFLLIVGFILFLSSKNSRLRKLIHSLKEINTLSKVAIIVPVLTLSSVFVNAQSASADVVIYLKENKIDSKHAGKFGAMAIQSSDGRIKPVNTFSSEVLRKLHKSDNIWGMNSDQFLLSLLAFPEMWMHVPFIGNNHTYAEFFDSNGNYKLQKEIEEIYHKSPSERNKFERDLLKLDEQIHIFHHLLYFEILDKDYLNSIRLGLKTGDWEKADEALNRIIISRQEKDANLALDINKTKAELLYNKLNIFRLCKKIYLTVGGILLILAAASLFWVRDTRYKVHGTYPQPSTLYRTPCTQLLIPLLSLLILCGFLYHLFGIGLRWYIAGYAPWSNSYETMVFASSISILAGTIFYRQNKIVFALAVLFGGIILFVSGLNWMDPQISSLAPVLKSPWLMFHVAVIMISYGFFGVSFLLGLINLVLLKVSKKKKNEIISLRIRELSIINEISLWTGLSFLTIGTFLGAIWANESWGRYWGWDPKETWTLITIIAYTIVTHSVFTSKNDNQKWLNAGSVIAFICVLMTYFGVNYFLSGMHSYG
jgi:cytochrome c-type biogenesis protein CcsB